MESKHFPKSRLNLSDFRFADKSQILNLCFRPLYYPLKLSGLFPIRIEKDGSTRFKWLSPSMLGAAVSALVFLADSYIFLPFVFRVMGASQRSFMEYAAEFAFSAGNYLAALSLIFLLPYMGPRLSLFWNRLNKTMKFLSENGMVYKFGVVRTFARCYVVLWTSYSLVYCGLNWWYFDKHLKQYFGESDTTFYVMSILGQTMFTTLIAVHNLHSMGFMIFAALISQSYKALGKLAEFNETEGKQGRLEKLIDIYQDLNSLVYFLGGTYGVYLIIEILTMLTSILTNSYFIFSAIRVSPTTFSSVAICLLWLFMVCNVGEYQRQSALQCQKFLKNAALHGQSSGRLIATRLGDDPPYISACNYFSINRQLMTKVIGTVTTYLVVLLQFHFKAATSDS